MVGLPRASLQKAVAGAELSSAGMKTSIAFLHFIFINAPLAFGKTKATVDAHRPRGTLKTGEPQKEPGTARSRSKHFTKFPGECSWQNRKHLRCRPPSVLPG